MDEGFVKLDTVHDVNEYLGLKENHPLLDVINLSEISVIKHIPKCFGLYGMVCNMSVTDVDLDSSDNAGSVEASLSFFAPGQIGRYRSGLVISPKGGMLLFHKDIIQDTVLEHYLSLCHFFESCNTLRLNGVERDVIVSCMLSMRHELLGQQDAHTRNILVSGLSVILCQCMRLYDKQFGCNDSGRHTIMSRLDVLLNDYITVGNIGNKTIPTVAWCAKQLHLSANYFGDLVKRKTGRSAQEYIQRRIIDEAKILLTSGRFTISEIAYRLGFKYPHHLTRMFHRIEGCTPNQYRLNVTRKM